MNIQAFTHAGGGAIEVEIVFTQEGGTHVLFMNVQGPTTHSQQVKRNVISQCSFTFLMLLDCRV